MEKTGSDPSLSGIPTVVRRAAALPDRLGARLCGSAGVQCGGFVFEGARALDRLEPCGASVSSAQGGGQLALCDSAWGAGQEFGFQSVGAGAKAFARGLGYKRMVISRCSWRPTLSRNVLPPLRTVRPIGYTWARPVVAVAKIERIERTNRSKTFISTRWCPTAKSVCARSRVRRAARPQPCTKPAQAPARLGRTGVWPCAAARPAPSRAAVVRGA